MSAYPLQGPFMKLRRADLHVQSLQSSMKGFIGGDPYDTWEEPIDPKPPYIESFIVRSKELQRPPREEWGAMIGDVVHNLRSALDHLVWELTESHQSHRPENPVPDKWRNIGFPIFKKADADSLAKIERMLWGINPELKPTFERLQPFNSSPPDLDPLWLLRELWNVDKHRYVHIAVVKSKIQSLGYVAAGKGTFELTQGNEPELTDNGELFRVHRSEVDPRLPGIQIEIRGGVRTLFGTDSAAQGLSVLETLGRMHDLVASILTRLRPSL